MHRNVRLPLHEHFEYTEKLLLALSSCSGPPNQYTDNLLSSLEELTEQILRADRRLVSSVEQLMEHQKQQMIIQELKKELKTADDRILDYASALRCSEQSLVELLNKHKYVIDSARKDMDIARVDPKDIVAYAHLIAGTTSAPAQWKPGFPMFGFAPPAPQEQMMRAGVLSRGVVAETVTRNTIEAPSTSFVSKPSTVDAIDSTNIPVGISAGEGRTVPPGWKSGDTIETPKDMCLPPVSAAFVKENDVKVPEGWVEGDPIPLALESNKKRKIESRSSTDSSSEEDNSNVNTVQLSLSSDEDDDSD